jgi:integrase
MPRPKTGPKLYTREQGGVLRYYADLRSVGGGRIALKAPGETLATTDPVIAAKLFAERLTKLQESRQSRVLLGLDRHATLAEFAAHHLVQKAKSRKVTAGWLEESQVKLEHAIRFLCNDGRELPRHPVTGRVLIERIQDRELTSIRVSDVQRYVNWLGEQPNGRGGTLTGATIARYLAALSNLFKRAASEECVPPGYNPVAAMMDKPSGEPEEARWLEVPDAALLLESARTWKPDGDAGANPAVHAIIATFLLTGGRESEVLGLAVSDLSFDRRTVTFRPHPWRRLKTRTSHRTVPMWPQLEAILREHVFGGDGPPREGLLFPSARGKAAREADRMVTDLRKALDAIARRAGWEDGEIRSKAFRHTYCAARLQTLDRGAPVSLYTVSREMGHGGDRLVKRIYGHLGDVRHRSEVVEFRVDQHCEKLHDRLVGLRSG